MEHPSNTITNLPTTLDFDLTNGQFSPCPHLDARRVSDLAVMFSDQEAVRKAVAAGNPVVYEIRHYPFLTEKTDMALGSSMILPGTVGDEYFMTKGHMHERDDQAEIYYCVHGEGILLMDDMQGDFRAVPWKPGTITHIPPQYAHRVVNTGAIPLVFVSAFHVSAGHVYEPVIKKGFAALVLKRNGKPELTVNPKRME
jgi:glucose-6-phosphate isomerase